jgi:hypothetical protein
VGQEQRKQQEIEEGQMEKGRMDEGGQEQTQQEEEREQEQRLLEEKDGHMEGKVQELRLQQQQESQVSTLYLCISVWGKCIACISDIKRLPHRTHDVIYHARGGLMSLRSSVCYVM